MIQAVGGYWRPIAGFARVVEELGELAEQTRRLDDGVGDLAALAEEVADLWIISACIANQYGIDLTLHAMSAPRAPASQLLTDMLQDVGRLARALNYYDGPKTPRTLVDWTPLGTFSATYTGA